MPPAGQVREALERIVSSEVFARSERARDLLRYLVEQDLSGHSDRLKGFSIAVDVFGKDDRFDPSTDTVVRVQAGRLRELLDQYYAEAGADDRLRISIPRGSYVPAYDIHHADAKTDPVALAGDGLSEGSDAGEVEVQVAAAPVTSDPRLVRQLRLLSGLVAALSAIICYMAFDSYFGSFGSEATVAGSQQEAESDLAPVALEALPAVHVAQKGNSDAVQQVAAVLRRGIPGFDAVDLVSSVPTDRNSARADDFVIAVLDGGGGEVHLEVENVRSGRVLLTRAITASHTEGDSLEDEIADMLTSVVTTSGAMYAYLREAGLDFGLSRCLILSDLYYRDQIEDEHRQAYECYERLIQQGLLSHLVYSELASLHMEAITDRHAYPADPTRAQALDFARRALELGPNSPSAHRSYGYVISRTASDDETLRWARRAYELNRFDLGMAAYYAYELIFSGRYDEGTPIMQRAVSAASSHPSWWDYALFLGHFMLSDESRAADAISALGASKRGHYLAARLVVAYERGENREVLRLIEEMGRDYPAFVDDPTSYFRRGRYPEDMIKRFVGALQEAGLVKRSEARL